MHSMIQHFAIKGTPVICQCYGCGHINETYLCVCNSGLCYILQKINQTVFPHPAELMENVAAVTGFLAEQSSNPRSTTHVVPTLDGDNFYTDEQGQIWRVYDFVPSTVCQQTVENDRDFYNTGLAFGRFQRQLAAFPAHKLYDVIPDFHNTVARFRQLEKALEENRSGRKEECLPEITFALARAGEAGAIVDRLQDGRLPLRVTHNDTKINNILLDYDTREPVCIIDLDTVMPGSALYDFGDAIRFGASTAPEDEKDLSKVECDMALFRAYTEGFLAGCEGSLTEEELRMLPMGAKLMTLECGIRFLADYLNGDVYFRVHYATQNLDRARTQFKLVADMEAKWATMHRIVAEAVGAAACQ